MPKPVYCAQTEQRFSSFSEAERVLGVSRKAIKRVLNTLERVNNLNFCTDLSVFENVDLTSDGYAFYCYETEKGFYTIAEAMEYYGVTYNAIYSVIDDPNKSCKGFHFCTFLDVFEGTELTQCKTPVCCVELDLWFSGIREAARYFEIDHKSIQKVVDKPNRTAKGFHFYTYSKKIGELQLTGKNRKVLFCKENGKRFSSVSEAAAFAGVSAPFLGKSVNDENKTAGGHHWCTDLSIFEGKTLSIPKSCSSDLELSLINYVKGLNSNTVENSRKVITPYELDIYIPEHNLAIEFNGDYWHSEDHKPRDYHINKTNMCTDKGIQLIQIFEHQWNNKSEIFKSLIANKLGKSNKIYARKCKIVELKDCKEFLYSNHLQGNCPSSIKLGLTYNDELVSVMTFGKPRFNKSYEYELIRFCNKLNTSVVGGASKLLKYFETKYQPKSLVSYANLQWSDGGLYNKLGFTFIKVSEPNYWWMRSNVVLSRYQCKKHKLKDLLGDKFNPDLSEKENMENSKYHRLFDCGNMVFVKEYN